MPGELLPIRTLLNTPRFDVIEHRVRDPSGGEKSCVAVDHPGAVVILPYVDDDQICLIRNHRLTVGKTLIELPAGTREPGEEPLETAHRELIEETGYRAETLTPLCEFFASPGICNERMFVFEARGLNAGPPAREENEQIENLVVRWDAALRMVQAGEIEDGKTIAALLMAHVGSIPN